MNIKYQIRSVLVCVGLVLFFILPSTIFAQRNSVLAEGKWYKIKISQTGAIKITGALLADNGINLAGIDPTRIKIYGSGGKMLPQQNNLSRPDGLEQVPIFVQSATESSFTAEDYIVFYGQSPHTLYYQDKRKAYVYEKNIYEENSYYFITFVGEKGDRIEDRSPISGNFDEIHSFQDVVVHEKEQYNVLTSGRTWYGEFFSSTLQYDIDLEMPGTVRGATGKLISNVMAQSYASSSFDIALDGAKITEQTIGGVSSVPYSIVGRDKSDTISFTQTESAASLRYSYNKNNSGKSIAYLNNVLVQYQRTLNFDSDWLGFNSADANNTGFFTFVVSEAPQDVLVWNVTNPQQPINSDYSWQDSELFLSDFISEVQSYLVFNPLAPLHTPEWLGEVDNQNIRGKTTPELLIITAPEFVSAAQALANHRRSFSGLETMVLTTTQVYNEFSSGSKEVTAIRDCAKYFYDQNDRHFKYVLLFGKGTYDNKNIRGLSNNFVPIYQSRNSLNPLTTYGSDDYIGFLIDGKGEWEESYAGDHTLDIGVGRIPVKTLSEAQGVVDKIINYDVSEFRFGAWRNDVVFVADDGDYNIHQRDANIMATNLENNYTSFHPKRLFIDDFFQSTSAGGQKVTEASEALYTQVHEGALIVNYTGHGAEFGWASEKLLDEFDIQTWTNRYRLPLFVTATCEFGRHDDPARVSGGEKIILHPNGGGIGLVTTSRPVISSNNFDLNQAFYAAVFEKQNGEYPTLGEVFRQTKNNSLRGASNRNFSLLADPSQRLAYPSKNIVLETVNGQIPSSVQIKANEKVTISGSVQEANGEIMADFNGVIQASFYDKRQSKTSLGDESAPYEYQTYSNLLFKGEVTVRNGEFTVNFIVPKNIVYKVGFGKAILYGLSEEEVDANGGTTALKIGGSTSLDISDQEGPEISLYLNDTTFTNGDIVGQNTLVMAKMSDINGINLTSNGTANQMQLVLDQQQVFLVQEFFNYSTDSYTEGWLQFPINNLEPGIHELEVFTWDNLNNYSTKQIVFEVKQKDGVDILELGNYPNPMQQETTFYFKHNKTGDDLLLELSIIDFNGKAVTLYTGKVLNSNSLVELMQWDGSCPCGKAFENGAYIYVLKVQSKLDGSENLYYQRLIINK